MWSPLTDSRPRRQFVEYTFFPLVAPDWHCWEINTQCDRNHRLSGAPCLKIDSVIFGGDRNGRKNSFA